MNILTVLGNFLNGLGSLVPRLYVVHWAHAGVIWTAGRTPKVLKPGVRLIWPIIQSAENVPTEMTQWMTLSTAPLTTMDGFMVQVGVVFPYKITNVWQYFVENEDADEGVDDVSLGAVRDLVARMEFDELRGSLGETSAALSKELQGQLTEFGITVLGDAIITSFHETQSHTISGDGLAIQAG